jgi:hypothetical protein
MRARLLSAFLRASPGPVLGALSGVGVAAAIVLGGPGAEAKSSFESTYGYDRTWNTALRLVRVDMGLKVTEKDEQNGYLLFEYRSSESGSKTTPGSLELVRTKGEGGPVRVAAQLPQMPSYHEQVLIDALAKKLRQEYGDPPRLPAPSKPTKPADAGTDAAPSED